MKKLGMTFLLVSTVVVAALLGSGLFFKVSATDNPYSQVVVFSEVLSLVLDNYVDPVEAEDLMEGAYEGMLRGLDPHAAYLDPGELAAWKANGADLTAGPGVTVLKGYGALQIVAVDPGSPAERAGLAAGDQIRAIDGVLQRDSSLDQALRMLRGPAGTEVALQVVHPTEGFVQEEIAIARRSRGRVDYGLEDRNGILVLSPRDLTRVDTGRLASELDDYASRGIGQLLIDLRNVADGSLREAAALIALFHGDGGYTLTDRAGETLDTVEIPEGRTAWKGSLALLVNGATAGAAEGFARLLQASDSAVIYGETTYGMGSEAELYELPGGAGVLVASREWRLASGESWHGGGVVPGVSVQPEGRNYAERLENQIDNVLQQMAVAR